MGFLIDLSIGAGAILAAGYCMLLSRRLRALTQLDGDVGMAIAVLSKQVDELTMALKAAEQSNSHANLALDAQIERADVTARRLELLMAASQASNPDIKATEAVTARQVHDAPAPDDSFAPFSRAATREGTVTRARVMRQREPAGAAR